MSATIRLNIDDNPRIVVKQDQTQVVVTGYTATVLVPSGATMTEYVSGNTWIIYTNPTGTTTTLVGSGGTWAGNISGNTWVVYTEDWTDEIIGLTISAQTQQQNYTGLTADIQYISGQTDYHYLQFTGLTDYINSLIIPAITGNSADIQYISGQTDNNNIQFTGLTASFNSHTGDTNIHYPQSGISITESQISDLKQYITGYTVTAGDVTGITSGLYAPIVHVHNQYSLTGHTHSQYLTGVTWNDVTSKPDLTLQSDFTGHTSNVNIHYPMSGISITESQISDLKPYITGITCSDVTGCTDGLYANIVHVHPQYSLTGHTHSYNNLTDKPNLTGFTLTSDFNTFTGTTLPANYYNKTEVDGLISGFTTGSTSNVILVGSGATEVTNISGDTWIVYSPTGGTSGGVWGTITGTLSGQTDLQLALNGKSDTGHTHAQYLTGYTVTAGDVTGITTSLYAPIVHTHAISGVTNLQTALDGKSNINKTIISINTTTTLNATHAGKIIECNGTFTLTLPNSMNTGMQVDIVNIGTGTITLAASTTLQSSGTKLVTQYTGASVYHRGSNIWLAVGRLTT